MAYVTSSGAPCTIRRASIFKRGLQALFAADAAYRDRARLRNMSTEQLQDIGLTQDQLARELKRPVWDAPQIMLR